MAKSKRMPRLLASELEILEMLWRAESVTIVEAQRAMREQAAYTTVQTRLNRMVKKGLVRKSRSSPAKYSAGITAAEVTSHDLRLLVDKVTRGRVVPLVAHLVKDRSLTATELCELRTLIDEAEKNAPSRERKRGDS